MMQTGAVWVVAALLGASIAAQQPKPQFEVASVKPQGESISGGSLGNAVSSAANAMPRARPGGLFNPTHASVEHLVMFAYDLRPYRIVGGPDWMRRDLFQINARAESDAPAGQIRLMVQSLLEDRFKLVTHVEPREMRFQALVRARPDGPLGPSLFTIDECTTAIVNELRRKFPDKYPTPIVSGMTSGCSRTGVSDLADLLTFRLGTPVIDATGLKGSFYYTIRSQFPEALPTLLGAAVNIDPSLPALSTALDEQLGLKLESRRGPVDVLVIDSVQQPTEN
jgi:uncharacterized protein (TIGR03435 family)